MAYGVKVKFRDDDWVWYAGSPSFGNPTTFNIEKGTSRLTFKTKSDAMVWCNNSNVKDIGNRARIEEFDASSYCMNIGDLFDKCGFCDCWKNEDL